MGLKPANEANDPKALVFTKHVLKLEVLGPDVSALWTLLTHW